MQDVELFLSEEMEKMRNSPWLHLFIAQYVQVYRENKHVEALHIAAAEVSSAKCCQPLESRSQFLCVPSFAQSSDAPYDVAFLVQLRRAQIRQSDTSTGTGVMSVNSRLRFERFRVKADEYTLIARQEQANFWSEMSSVDPSLTVLDTVGKAFEDSCTKAEVAFQELLRLNPASSHILRRYAVFLEEVWGAINRLMTQGIVRSNRGGRVVWRRWRMIP